MSTPREKKYWSESFGDYGSTIRVAERTPGGILYLLWIDNRGKQRKRSLRYRDRKRGREQAKAFAALLESQPVVQSGPAPLTLVGGDLAGIRSGGGYVSDADQAREGGPPVGRASG